MDLATAKLMIRSIEGSQRRNRVSGRTVKPIEINAQDLIEMYHKQDGKCYWSGLPLDQSYNKIKFHPFAISPERLDNSLPYTKENVRLCRRIFNLGRIAFPEKMFEEVMTSLKKEMKNL